MRAVTGVELGPDSCVLVRVRPSGDRLQVSAVRGLREEDWDARRPLAQNLAEARRTDRLPRHARVVAWGLPESAANDPGDITTRTLVAPLREAGFDVETVMSPAQALALLARRRPRPAGRDGAVWLAVNRQGAAIAIVFAGELLYSREFDWHYRPAASVKEELLQRYSLVAHLAPEVRHGLDIVRAQRDVPITAVVTCGDLPDLRSLTMPLIEELDIEVETLDTLEEMELTRAGDRDGLADRASALCLAATVGAGDLSGDRARQKRVWLAAAAAVAVIAVAAGWLIGRTGTPAPPSGAAAPPSVGRTVSPQGAISGPAAAPTQPQTSEAPAAPVADRPAAPAAPVSTEASLTAATTGRQEAPSPAQPGSREPAGARRAAAEPAVPATPVRTDRPAAAPVPVRPVARVMKPLRAPLPTVNSILVAPDRRLAVVAGEIVREGDAVGPRTLIRIEPDAVVLREPSGHEVRVPIRRKLS